MLRFLLLRVGQGTIPVIGVSIIAFLLVHLSGNPAALVAPPEASQEEVEELAVVMGLDRPLHEQYLDFAGRALRGDLGRSFRSGYPNLELIKIRFPPTLLLISTALLFALVVAVGVGTVSAVWRGSWIDTGAKGFVILGQSAPVFWTGIMAILIFSVRLRVLPPSGFTTPKQLILPAVTLGLFLAADLTRYVRNGLLEVLGEDYVRSARAKGLPEWAVIIKHVLRTGLISVITVVGLRYGMLLGGAVVTETVFSFPGMGTLVVEAVKNRDVPLVQATLMFTGLVIVVTTILTDLTYSLVDPRIRLR